MKNSIVKRIYAAWKIQLDSPVNISGGENLVTDSDLQRNGDGEIFIPGTSFAGAFRDYLEQKKDQEGIFGFSKGEKGFMSKVFISDVYFTNEVKVSIRDGICLKEDKTVRDQGKFDQEIVETGAQGMLYLEGIIREKDKEQDIVDGIRRIAWGIQNGEIRLGSKKTRGFGKIKILEIYEKSFTEHTRDEWLTFLDKKYSTDVYDEVDLEKYLNDGIEYDRKYLKITVPLRQRGGISIRRYCAQPDKADFEHITCHGQPVIPGSSWNGAIRADAVRILKVLGCSQRNRLIDYWFGHVPQKGATGYEAKAGAEKSMVTVSESILTDPVDGKLVNIPMSRNRINRFDSSTVNGALYSEIACFNGHTDLELYIDKKDGYLALTALLLLVIKNIQNGFLAVGGQTAVGRGIFAPDGEIRYSEAIDEKVCQSELCGILNMQVKEG